MPNLIEISKSLISVYGWATLTSIYFVVYAGAIGFGVWYKRVTDTKPPGTYSLEDLATIRLWRATLRRQKVNAIRWATANTVVVLATTFLAMPEFLSTLSLAKYGLLTAGLSAAFFSTAGGLFSQIFNSTISDWVDHMVDPRHYEGISMERGMDPVRVTPDPVMVALNKVDVSQNSALPPKVEPFLAEIIDGSGNQVSVVQHV